MTRLASTSKSITTRGGSLGVTLCSARRNCPFRLVRAGRTPDNSASAVKKSLPKLTWAKLCVDVASRSSRLLRAGSLPAAINFRPSSRVGVLSCRPAIEAARYNWSALPCRGHTTRGVHRMAVDNQPLLWTGPRRVDVLLSSGGCQRVALPATERHPLYIRGILARLRLNREQAAAEAKRLALEYIATLPNAQSARCLCAVPDIFAPRSHASKFPVVWSVGFVFHPPDVVMDGGELFVSRRNRDRSDYPAFSGERRKRPLLPYRFIVPSKQLSGLALREKSARILVWIAPAAYPERSL
jgi:hypothetical protein